ncbi:hypothetical protein IMZ48_25265 [Candidatus Bathyarchaeota archaeon]|nr:hypothetical protein [Candidatus Bathyarchaeota archaeon]
MRVGASISDGLLPQGMAYTPDKQDTLRHGHGHGHGHGGERAAREVRMK